MYFVPVHFRRRGPDDVDDSLSGPRRHEGLELFRRVLCADLVAVGGVRVEQPDGVEGAPLVGADQRAGPVVHAEVGGDLLGRAEVPLVVVLVVWADSPGARFNRKSLSFNLKNHLIYGLRFPTLRMLRK